MRRGMTITLRSSILALAVLASLGGCNRAKEAPLPSASPGAAAENPAMPVAKYAGKIVTLKEVDAQLKSELKRLDKQKMEMRQQAAEQIAVQAMVKDEAAKESITEQDWFAKHVDSQIPTPSEDAIKGVFEQNKARMPPDASLASMREQIIRYLGEDQRRSLALKAFDELKKKNGYQMVFEEPRTVVEAKGPSRGPADAKVTIVEFSDFECPFCSRAEESVSQVMDHYAGKIRLVYRHFPLPNHANAGKAAEAAACANEQGKFWEMHKQLFANQTKLSVADLKAHAQAIGLDPAKFAECLDGGKMKVTVDTDQKVGAEAGVDGTPAFFINGQLLSGALPFTEFQKVIDAELAKGT